MSDNDQDVHDAWFAAYTGSLTREEFDRVTKTLEDTLVESLVHGVGSRSAAWDTYYATAGCTPDEAYAVFEAVDKVTPIT